jgi:hypothetical protein
MSYETEIKGPSSPIVLILAIIGGLLLIVSIFALVGGFAAGELQAMAGGIGGIVAACLLFAVNVVINRLSSIDTHLRQAVEELRSERSKT